ncbi:MAG: acylneuraminate cytidylyltransferase family protein [Desulfobacteraceae bacterium]|jgi:CMP-N-acetylneuraminic acid synthetase
MIKEIQQTYSSQKIIALLPMKGHSERVSNKNIRPFAGEPLFFHVARVLQESDMVASIIINTDSEYITNTATEQFSKVRIIDRPQSIRGDFVSMNTIIAHDLSVTSGEHFLQTHSTNPLLTRVTLDRAIKEYFAMEKCHDSLFSVTALQTRLYWESGKPVNHNPQELLRTQDLPTLFEENSNLYLFSRSSFAAAGDKRIGNSPKMFVMDSLEAIDIDNSETFFLAEAVHAMRSVENVEASI